MADFCSAPLADFYAAVDIAAYVEQVLVPELEPGTVVILDNPATHKNAAASKAMRKAGCWFHCSGKTPHWGLF